MSMVRNEYFSLVLTRVKDVQAAELKKRQGRILEKVEIRKADVVEILGWINLQDLSKGTKGIKAGDWWGSDRELLTMDKIIEV